ncbi:NAD-dependent epimerase/dehydratase family protein [Nonomuraea sp. NPDC050328]|uniref:NAD-dependent epimerase/dehydratase family protein n=1 Tax=Nonomuraea sp. NPDC050328 TaxID=3364361 RepID=UPI0037A52F07
MKILLAGATGYIGGVVAEKLLERGHEVVALVRQAGRLPYEERVADLADPAAVAAAVTPDVDAVVHAAQLTGDPEVDLATVTALTARPVHYLSGVWVLGETRDGTEDSPVDPYPIVAHRPEIEQLVLGAGGSVVRPGVVHGRGQGIVALLKSVAAERGTGVYVSADGQAPTWTFVNVDDLADLVVLAAERGVSGEILHAIAEEAVPVEEVAVAAARAAGVKPEARPWPLAEAAQLLGEPFAGALARSQRVSSARTRQAHGWVPTRLGVLSDLVEGSYAP